MTIGASFLLSFRAGISTTIAMFNHELAHEAGDFIIYMQSGNSLLRSLTYNLFTGLGNLCGCLLALNYGEIYAVETYILPLAVGNFLYIALSSMLGGLTRNGNKGNLFYELLFLCLGVALIVIIETSD